MRIDPLCPQPSKERPSIPWWGRGGRKCSEIGIAAGRLTAIMGRSGVLGPQTSAREIGYARRGPGSTQRKEGALNPAITSSLVPQPVYKVAIVGHALLG